jgi:hypothetical protein
MCKGQSGVCVSVCECVFVCVSLQSNVFYLYSPVVPGPHLSRKSILIKYCCDFQQSHQANTRIIH